jgi:hypothetical protein
MKFRCLALFALFGLAFMVIPASAFTAQNLAITIQDNGDANINFHYQLSWIEQIIFPVIPGKEQVVQSALTSKFPSATIENTYVSDTSTTLTVRGFSWISTTEGIPGTITYTTPAISFLMAQDFLNTFPYAWAITPDFSPETTVVQFPDSHQYRFTDTSGIPAITYTGTK